MKVLNKQQVRKLLATTKHNLDSNQVLLLRKEKKVYLTTKAVAMLNATHLHIRSTGLFLGTLEGKKLKVASNARYLFSA